MSYGSLLPAIGVLLVAAAGCGAPRATRPGQERSGDTVRALRYRTIISDSVLEFSHGMYRRVEVLYFPDRRIAAMLDQESSWDEKEKNYRHVPVLYTRFGEIGNKYFLPGKKGETVEPTEEVRVPLEIAREIESLADLQKRLKEEERVLGDRVVAAGLLRAEVKPPAGRGEEAEK